jgi:hypothetical protein
VHNYFCKDISFSNDSRPLLSHTFQKETEHQSHSSLSFFKNIYLQEVDVLIMEDSVSKDFWFLFRRPVSFESNTVQVNLQIWLEQVLLLHASFLSVFRFCVLQTLRSHVPCIHNVSWNAVFSNSSQFIDPRWETCWLDYISHSQVFTFKTGQAIGFDPSFLWSAVLIDQRHFQAPECIPSHQQFSG